MSVIKCARSWRASSFSGGLCTWSMSDKAADRRARKAAAAWACRQDLEVRAHEAEAARKRREADPELKAHEAAAKHAQRQADAKLRAREAAMKRAHRQADREAVQAPEAAAKHLKHSLPEGADTRFKRDFLDCSFSHSCKVCNRLWFDNNLLTVSSIRNE